MLYFTSIIIIIIISIISSSSSSSSSSSRIFNITLSKGFRICRLHPQQERDSPQKKSSM